MKALLPKSTITATLVSAFLLSDIAKAGIIKDGINLFSKPISNRMSKLPSTLNRITPSRQLTLGKSLHINKIRTYSQNQYNQNNDSYRNQRNTKKRAFMSGIMGVTATTAVQSLKDQNEQQDKSLYNAAAEGDTNRVKLLLEAGANVNYKIDYGKKTPLIIAAENGHTEIVELLLTSGAKVNLRNEYDESALIVAINNGHAQIAKLLINHQADLNTTFGTYRTTPLIWAAEKGHTEIVELLLTSGANVNHKNSYYETALQLAIENGHVQIAKLLINHGANLNSTHGFSGETPLMTAERLDVREIVDIILKKEEADLKKHEGESKDNSLHFESTKAYQDLINKIRISLQKPECKNVVILGNPGVGKTQLVMKFLADIGNGKFPELPKNTLVKSVNIGTFLDSKSQFVGQVQDKLNKFLSMMSSHKNSIIFMDEIHSFRGAGTTKSDSNDLFQHMKSYLAKGDVTLIGTSTHSEFYEAFGGDQALLRRFSIINLEEPSEEELPNYINGWSKRYNKPILKADVLKHIIHLSNEFSASGSQPSKATGLLSEVYATKQLKDDNVSDITIQDINQAASRLYNIDPIFFDTHKVEEKIQNFPDFLNQTLIGQTFAKDILFELVEQRFTHSHDKTKPALRVLVAGLPGVGKTELGRTLGKGMNLPSVRIEMNKYAEGNVEGFRREMAEVIRKNAYSVIILDELEKAAPTVQQALLALLDSGEMTISENINSNQSGGKTSNILNFKNSHIFATTNAAQQLLHSNTKPVTKNELTQELIRGGIPAPVLDRFQAAVPIFPPSETEFRAIIQLGLKRLIQEQELESKKSIQIENEKEFLDNITSKYLIAQSKGEILNGREAQRILQTTVRSSIAKAKRKSIASSESNLSIYLPIHSRE